MCTTIGLHIRISGYIILATKYTNISKWLFYIENKVGYVILVYVTMTLYHSSKKELFITFQWCFCLVERWLGCHSPNPKPLHHHFFLPYFNQITIIFVMQAIILSIEISRKSRHIIQLGWTSHANQPIVLLDKTRTNLPSARLSKSSKSPLVRLIISYILKTRKVHYRSQKFQLFVPWSLN